MSLNRNKAIDLQILTKNVDFNSSMSMLLLIHQPLLKVASKMKTLSFNTMMNFTQQEPLQHFFPYIFPKKVKNGLGLDSEAGMLGVYSAEGPRCAKN